MEGISRDKPRGPQAPAAAAQAGLIVERMLPGFWCSDQKRPINEQDLVLFRRPE